MVNIIKVWSMATVLMNDGVSNQDYLEQLTYLLFLKMIDEYGICRGLEGEIIPNINNLLTKI